MQGSTARYIWMTVLAAVVVATAAMAVASWDDEVREIRLVARDMTFYLEGSDVPNPTLTLDAGEQVKILLRNGDPGMDHDFSVRDWNVGTPLLEGKGTEAAIEFRAPAARGTHVYTCTPHSATMRGTIEVK